MSEAATVHSVTVEVNGERVERVVGSSELLVHFVRDTLGLKGTHIGCDTGNCGACTVRLDGQLVKSCMVLAVQADECELETVEGESQDDLRDAFEAEHALQCGYCTPGMVAAASFLLERNANPGSDEIRRALKGNICRCTGYENIVRAIERVAGTGEGGRA